MNNRNQIISDARVLTADYLPNKMVHRDGERKEISRGLKPLMNDSEPMNMLIYGPPGTGKTAMSKYVIQELQKNMFVGFSYVNCFSQPSKHEIFYELLDKKASIPRDGTSTEKLVEKFEEKVRRNPSVIVIDEVDQISSDEVLFELSRFQKAGILLISNNPNIFANFDDRVRSRFSGVKRIRFQRYEDSEILDILRSRREHGLYPDVVSDSQLRKIASKANGDARVAINSLKIAAQDAENQDLEEITDSVIDNSVSDAYQENKSESLDKLNRHQRAIYSILQEEDVLDSGELFDRYRTDVEDSKSRRTFRRYMKKMDAYGLVDINGENKGRSYSLAS